MSEINNDGWVHRFNSEAEFLEYLKMSREIQRLQTELSSKEEEIKELKAWKESATSVMPDYQTIGKLIGVRLGDSVHDKIIPYLQKVQSELSQLKPSMGGQAEVQSSEPVASPSCTSGNAIEQYREWQVCPKCNGQGTVSKPSYVPGDINQWTGTSIAHVCDVCNGAKILARPLLNSEQAPETSAATEHNSGLVEVYSRDECPFHYCDSPNGECKTNNKCHHTG